MRRDIGSPERSLAGRGAESGLLYPPLSMVVGLRYAGGCNFARHSHTEVGRLGLKPFASGASDKLWEYFRLREKNQLLASLRRS